MPYVTSNPPAKVVADIGNNGPQRWTYQSADNIATVQGAGYFSNAKDLGMKVNDIVEVTDTATPLVSDTRVKSISAAGAATVAVGVTVGNTA